jgi:hypothetical protein
MNKKAIEMLKLVLLMFRIKVYMNHWAWTLSQFIKFSLANEKLSYYLTIYPKIFHYQMEVSKMNHFKCSFVTKRIYRSDFITDTAHIWY